MKQRMEKAVAAGSGGEAGEKVMEPLRKRHKADKVSLQRSSHKVAILILSKGDRVTEIISFERSFLINIAAKKASSKDEAFWVVFDYLLFKCFPF